MSDTAPVVAETSAPVENVVVDTAAIAKTPEAAVEPTPGSDEHFEAALAAALKEAGTVQEGKDREAAAEVAKVKDEPAKDEPAKEEPVKVEAKDEPKDKGTLGKARRLFAEGKVEEALELALGINLDKIEPTTKQWKAVKRQVTESRTEANKAKTEAANEVQRAQRAVQQVMPFVDGAQAYLAGDYAKFLQLTTGDTPEAFQRKLIAQLHETPGAADPRVMAEIEQLKRERAQEREAWKAEQARVAQENNQLKYQQAQQNWVAGISNELKAVPQFARVASKPAFLQRVFALQQHMYNPKTQETMDTIEAAEMIWEDLYGDVVETPPAAGAQAGTTQATRANVANPPHTGTSVANKTTTLRQTATEAAPEGNEQWSRENQDKILERYARIAKSEQLQRSL